MVAVEIARQPIYGKTITDSFDGLLDKSNKDKKIKEDAIKQLLKVSFAHPSAAQQIRTVIRILEGNDREPRN